MIVDLSATIKKTPLNRHPEKAAGGRFIQDLNYISCFDPHVPVRGQTPIENDTNTNSNPGGVEPYFPVHSRFKI
jgi:hypothetical protein